MSIESVAKRLGFAANRDWVYTQSVQGFHTRIRNIGSVFLHLGLFVIPWIPIDGRPAVQLDLPARHLFVFGWIFDPTDTLIAVLLALIAALSLFFFTALYGRLWCGYLCPQTVLLDQHVRRIERLVEGERGVRRRRDQGPWSFDKIWRKAAKWSLFALSAFTVSMAFQSWFAGPIPLWTGQAGPVDYTLVSAFTLGWFLDFAWFREQACNYLCPYARFQGAMTDEHSLVIGYDVPRGEPRAKGKKSAKEGRCIDCNKCVVVCPAGIDIRDGFQLECLSCGLCVDACHGVMGKLGHESLVVHTTLAKDRGEVTRRLRPRTVVYSGLLMGLAFAVAVLLFTHSTMDASVNRAPGTSFIVEDGLVRNTFMVQVTNRDPKKEATYQVQVRGIDAEVIAPPVVVGPGQRSTVPLILRIAEGSTESTMPFEVVVGDGKAEKVLPATFKGPGR